MKRKAEVVMDNVSVDKKVNEDDIRAKLNELHYGFTCSSEAEARFLVLYEPFILTPNFTTDILFCPSTKLTPCQLRAPRAAPEAILAGSILSKPKTPSILTRLQSFLDVSSIDTSLPEAADAIVSGVTLWFKTEKVF
jgi:hypothetical protein